MADFVYPRSDLDRPDALLNAIGSFWSTTYDGMDLVQSILSGVAAVAAQAQDDAAELAAAVGRLGVPVLHTEQVTSLVIRQSQSGVGYAVPAFDDGRHGYDDGVTRYDTPDRTALFAYPLPDGLVAVPLIVNRLTRTSRTLVAGVDFVVDAGRLLFRTDPFADPLFARREVLRDDAVVDRELELWLLRAGADRRLVNDQFAYALGLSPPATQAGKDLVNALLDACTDGSAQKHLRAAWSAVTGVALGRGDGETVRVVRYEPSRLLVVTDRTVYSYGPEALPLVAAGDVVNRGDPLCDALLFFEFNAGQVPDVRYVKGLSLSRGLLAAGFFADLIFLNKDVPLAVAYDAEGFARVSFEVDGFPGDVEAFFDALHERGRAAGQTLAHLLDTRPAAARDTEPDALALPATVNPLAFLCRNVFRSNVQLVRVKTAACRGGVGLDAAKSLRMLVPPQATVIVLAELTYADDPITMDGPGGPSRPGYLETASPFLGNAFAESIDGSALIRESVRPFQVGGRCV